jgi:transposase InsO family protein
VLVVGPHQADRPSPLDLVLPVVILDIFRRYVVGWMVAAREAAALAERLLADTIAGRGRVDQ